MREAKSNSAHLVWIEVENLEPFETGRAGERYISLSAFEHAPKVNLDALERLALALMDRHGPTQDEG